MITLDHIAPDEDPLLVWAAQDMQPGSRAWALGDAAAVARHRVANRDRLAVRGNPGDLDRLLRRIRPEVSDLFPVGDEELIKATPGLAVVACFGWMDTTTPVPGAAADLVRVADDEVAAFLDAHHPHSFARPGWPGVPTWLGLRDDAGELQAVATDAWTTSRLGFISGVATRTDLRGRGLATRLCSALTNELLRGRERVALLVDHDNTAAVRTYERLGYAKRRIAAAKFAG
ncbi:GNAT family N-acetyltransferase [Actinoplanes sp. N902-109]|uniref:GNAT family N-acetyltransferase n=1 Tax=Actinoplanes sp. (strain N902-109) TaxID=649831 RepID=UPI0003A2436A|nr:GNAT family N-acetyltransferase [Actinoplanes sp. N902-109]